MLNWHCFDIKFSFEDNNHCFKFLRNLQIILSLQKVENKKLYPETYVWKYLIWIFGSLKLDIKSDNSGASFENGKILFLTSNCILTRLNIQQWSIYLIWMLHFATLVPFFSLLFFSSFLLSVPGQTLWQLSWPVTWCCALDWAPLTRDHESWSADDRQSLAHIVTREWGCYQWSPDHRMCHVRPELERSDVSIVPGPGESAGPLAERDLMRPVTWLSAPEQDFRS